MAQIMLFNDRKQFRGHGSKQKVKKNIEISDLEDPKHFCFAKGDRPPSSHL